MLHSLTHAERWVGNIPPFEGAVEFFGQGDETQRLFRPAVAVDAPTALTLVSNQVNRPAAMGIDVICRGLPLRVLACDDGIDLTHAQSRTSCIGY